jgi:hypothetical protein
MAVVPPRYVAVNAAGICFVCADCGTFLILLYRMIQSYITILKAVAPGAEKGGEDL